MSAAPDGNAILEAWETGQPIPAAEPAAPPVPQSLQKLRYTHDAMIDLVIANPAISQNMIAATFGYTAPSISRIINSDAFQARLHDRRKELVDPGILQSIEERFNSLAQQALGVIQERLEATRNLDTAFKALDISAKALGFGARQNNVNVQTSFVVALPEKAATQDAWLERYGRRVYSEPAQDAAPVPQLKEA